MELEAAVENLPPDQDRVDSVLSFDSAKDDHIETAGGQGRGEALSRSTTKAVGLVCDRDPGPKSERLLHVARDLQHGHRRHRGLRTTAFKLRGSKAILSFLLEAGKYDTIDVIKELKEEKVTKYAGGIVSCSKNMQRLFGTPTAMVFFNIHPFTLYFS